MNWIDKSKWSCRILFGSCHEIKVLHLPILKEQPNGLLVNTEKYRGEVDQSFIPTLEIT